MADVYLVRAIREDGLRHLSSNGWMTLCCIRVGWELPKTMWEKRPACQGCNEAG